MTHTARFTLDPAFTVGESGPRLFGAFVEHLGRCVYTGIFEPDHPAADEAGLRTDVLDLIRELGVTVIRYPGGNFVSGYKWEDSVGPVAQRPRRLDLAWRSTETHRFGLSEYAGFLRKLGPQAEPMMALNLGTRGVAETARAMRRVDPGVELVACGSSSRAMPTFAAWEATVLAETYDLVDHVSLHASYEEQDGDRGSFLASAVDMESFIEDTVATCDYVGARLKSTKRITLSFDEWNVWYMSRAQAEAAAAPQDWPEAPRLLEDHYSVTDAVVVGSLLIALLRHADQVAVACLAQLVNVIAPILTEPGGPAWRQTTFFPFAQASRYGRGQVLDVRVDSPTYDTAKYGEVPLLHATAVRDPRSGAVTVFAVNRSQDAALSLEVALYGLGVTRVAGHSALADADPEARNTLDAPDRVLPHEVAGTVLQGGTLRATLEPLSWHLIRLV
ncbi:alpha-N-arabinofuranosidase [Streptomyces olivaceiscleroticus]|uniref:non-reducing end alpha-L-arabinofuranosidase n=1 Tax=Streptomyces olivaceiscleroticus TaxID=68245 RepID=A0ABN1BGV8_9ACTN